MDVTANIEAKPAVDGSGQVVVMILILVLTSPHDSSMHENEAEELARLHV